MAARIRPQHLVWLLILCAVVATTFLMVLTMPLWADPTLDGDDSNRQQGVYYLPVIAGGAPPEGISGRVQHGLTTGPFTVTVEATHGRYWSTDIATTTTNAEGYFHFSGLPPTRPDAIYYSIRVDRPAADTASPPNYALSCRSYPIYDYRPGDRVLIPEFDTSAVHSIEPAHNLTTTLPVTFAWAMPSFTMPMTFQLRLHEPALDMGPLQYQFVWNTGTETSFTLSDANVPEQYQFGYVTEWSVDSYFVDGPYFRSPDTVYCKHSPIRAVTILPPP